MNTFLEFLGLALLIAAIVALWFLFKGDPSLIELLHRAAMKSAGGA